MEMNKNDVKITPKNAEVVITDVTEKLAIEVYGNKTDNPEQRMVSIAWENAKEGIKGEENVPYYEKEQLTDNTKLGQLLLKYDELKAGKKVIVEKNDKGFYKIAT